MNKIIQKLSCVFAFLLALVFVTFVVPFTANAETLEEEPETEQSSSTWYTLDYNDKTSTITLLLSADLNSWSDINADALTTLQNEIVSDLEDLVYNSIFGTSSSSDNKDSDATYAVRSRAKARVATVAESDDSGEILGGVSDETYAKFQSYIDSIKDNYSVAELIAEYIQGDTFDTVITYAVNVIASEKLDGEEYDPTSEAHQEIYASISNKINDVITEQITTALEDPEVKQELQEYFADFEDYADVDKDSSDWLTLDMLTTSLTTKTEETIIVNAQEKMENNDTSLSMSEILNILSSVTISYEDVSYVIYNTNNESDFDSAEILSLVKAVVPTLSEMADESFDFTKSFGVTINTSSGNFNFTFVLGLDGDTSRISNACKKLAKYVDFSYSGNTVKVNLTLPDRIYNAILNRSDKNWQGCFTADAEEILDSKFVVSDGNVYVQDLDASDVYTLINNINYDKIYSTASNKYEKLDNDSAYEKVLNYVNRVLNFFDNSVYNTNRVQNAIEGKTLLDFYTSDGSFNLSVNNVTINGEKISSKITNTSVFKSLPEEISSALKSSLEKVSKTVSLDVTVNLPQFNTVSFYVGDELIEQGLITSGSTLPEITTDYDIYGWVDANGNEVEVASDSDLVLYAVTNLDVNVLSVEKIYDGKSYELEVTPTLDLTFTYQWYKDGVKIDGATESTYSVTNVSDSATYYVEVTDTATGAVVTSEDIEVSISKATITLSNATATESVLYNGKEQSFELSYDAKLNGEVVESLKDYVVITYTDDSVLTATNNGTYKVAFKTVVSSNDNYAVVLASDFDSEYEWEIEKATITVSDAEYVSSITYDGTDHAFVLSYTATSNVADVTEETLKSYLTVNFDSKSDLSGKNSGSYKTVLASIVSSNDNYKVVLANDFATEYSWKIEKATIIITALKWSDYSDYQYNNTYHFVMVEDIEGKTKTDVEGFDLSKVLAGYYDCEGVYYAKDAGTYTAEVVFETLDNYFVELANGVSAVYKWSIAKATVTVTGLKWINTDNFVYNGNHYEVTVKQFTAEASYDGINVEYFLTTNSSYTNSSATDAGDNYETSITFKDTDNVEIIVDSDLSTSIKWSIAKRDIDVSRYVWDYTTEFVYDSSIGTYQVNLVNADTAVVNVVYTGNTATKAGEYTATAELSLNGFAESNYTLSGKTTLTCSWKVEKREIDVSSYVWDYTSNFVYDGTERKVELAYVDDLITVVYADNSKTNAGKYTATATLSLSDEDAENYKLSATTLECEWEIEAIKIDVSLYQWQYTTNFVYDGTKHTIVLLNVDDTVLDVTYSNNELTAPATQTASASFAVKSDYAGNYVIVNADKAQTATIVVDKMHINISNYSWNTQQASQIIYDGTVKTVQLVTYDERLVPTYTDNSKTEVGEYSATVTFAFANADYDNYYTITGSVDTLAWSIVESLVESTDRTFTYETLGITVINNTNVLFDGSRLSVNDTTDDFKSLTLTSISGTEGKVTILKTYDISVSNEGITATDKLVTSESGGSFTIKLVIPEEYRNIENLKVVYISADKQTVTDMSAERKDDSLIFVTTHFSTYAIVEFTPASAIDDITTPVATTSLIPGIVVLIAIILTLLIVISTIIIIRWKRNYTLY
jgi:hypothetical protein